MDGLLYYSGLAGFKFNPTDEELVGYYLFYRINQNPLANQFIIQDCDVYGAKEPWQIWENLGGATCNDDGFLYVFSLLKKEKGSDGGSDYNRNVGSNGGTWHGVGRGKSLRSGEISWTQKTFSYWNEQNRAEHGCWLMQEYSLDYLGNNGNNIVLCRIKNNHKKRKSTELDEEDRTVGYDQQEMGFKRSKVDAVPAPEKIKGKVEDSLFNAADAPVCLEGEELGECVNSILEEPLKDHTPLELEEKVEELVKHLKSASVDTAQDY